MTSPWETYDALIEDLPEDVAVVAAHPHATRLIPRGPGPFSLSR